MEGTTAVSMPKAVLHDHLDGGLRIDTMLDLAAEFGYEGLPATSSPELTDAMFQADSGSLENYLAAFVHTVGVMQTGSAVERVAYEAALDHHHAGVVYAEIRFGSALLAQGSLTQDETITAALNGFARGSDETGIEVVTIISALRNNPDSVPVAKAAARFVGKGVVGFDLAGPEAGYPASDHMEAIAVAQDAGLGITIHAGEGAGLASIEDALHCGAQRLGHGVRIIEDCQVVDGAITDLGNLAQQVFDAQIPLEVAISSNLHTGVADEPAQHPFGMLYRAGFNVSINTDNRLMSGIDMAEEVALAVAAFDLGVEDVADITLRAIQAGFGDEGRRAELSRSVGAHYTAAIADL